MTVECRVVVESTAVSESTPTGPDRTTEKRNKKKMTRTGIGVGSVSLMIEREAMILFCSLDRVDLNSGKPTTGSVSAIEETEEIVQKCCEDEKVRNSEE